ncbi:MAG: adenylate cyclase [Thermoleophilaceae bacterium]|jgi:class 3 adenylate cyclase|nr:adenylate cyclase [Thermoleophilaceae bacterium]
MLVLFARWAYRRLGLRYLYAYIAFEFLSALTITLGTVGIFSLYQHMTRAQFDRIVLFSWACVIVALLSGTAMMRRDLVPLFDWVRGRRGPEGAAEAWRAAVSLPRSVVMHQVWRPLVLVVLPVAVFITVELGLPAYSILVCSAGAMVAVAYTAILHFFASELALRPVLEEVSEHLSPGFELKGEGVPLRWKLLGSLPLINVITGVIVSGLSSNGTAHLNSLGVDVLVAVVVAFTVSFELTLLVTRTITWPVGDLLDATERVRSGDLSARVPVVTGDEMGELAQSFNAMMRGLEEREKLHDAFGRYVAPDVAERVLKEGELLEGEEVEISIVFVDIRDFTAFAERASARETVSYLNDFFGLAVPILTDHGGHANKFIGDGILGVFGAPERMRDHADRAVHASCDLARATSERYGDLLRIGIGINSGPVSAGTVGGGGRLEFTVIGDAVNVAARVERATRETGDTVLLTEASRCLLTDDRIEVEPRGELPLKGKSEPVALYAPSLDGPASGGSSRSPETAAAST